MKRRDPVEVQDPYSTRGYNNFSQNGQYTQQVPQSPSKYQTQNKNLYNFVPVNENTATIGYAVNETTFEENHLPHYVVPVLYIPQRIITNEEFYASELYDKNHISEEVYQERPIPQQLPNQVPPHYQNFQESLTPSRQQVAPQRRMSPHNHLTDSETNIYDELMKKLYGMQRSEEEIAVDNSFQDEDYIPPRNSQRQLLETVPEQVYQNVEQMQPKYSDPPKSTTSMRSQYIKQQAALRTKPSPIPQNYMLPNTSCTPSTSGYTVYPMKPPEYIVHQSLKDQRIENSRTRMVPRDSSVSRKHVASSRELIAPAVMQNMYRTSLVFREASPSESKCTQTTADIATDTENGDYDISNNSYDYMQKAEKGLLKTRPKAQSLNCSNADVTLIIDRGSEENIYTVLGSGSQFANLQQKTFDKGTDCLATVDLLPVTSSTLGNVGSNLLSIPKLRTHSRPSTPRPLTPRPFKQSAQIK